VDSMAIIFIFVGLLEEVKETQEFLGFDIKLL
jgi:hypothetical protein